MRNWIPKILYAAVAASSLAATGAAVAAEVTLLNVSYDVTREFYQDFNRAFAASWKAKTGDTVTVNQSHGGSSKQAQAVVNGLEADVVTMNQPLDADLLFSGARLIPKNWASRLPNHSVPYAKYTDRFKPVDLFTVNEIAGGWPEAQKTHFADGGIFDQIYQPKN